MNTFITRFLSLSIITSPSLCMYDDDADDADDVMDPEFHTHNSFQGDLSSIRRTRSRRRSTMMGRRSDIFLLYQVLLILSWSATRRHGVNSNRCGPYFSSAFSLPSSSFPTDQEAGFWCIVNWDICPPTTWECPLGRCHFARTFRHPS